MAGVVGGDRGVGSGRRLGLGRFPQPRSRRAILRTVRPEPVEGLSTVVENFAGLLTAGRGLPGGKLLSIVSPKESNQRKGDPDIPEFPKIKRIGWAAKNSPRFCSVN